MMGSKKVLCQARFPSARVSGQKEERERAEDNVKGTQAK
jgi:hypothetical protein